MSLPPLGRRSWTEHQNHLERPLLVPVGSFEQHGPHLPLSTDSIVAETLCADVAAELDVDVAPLLPFSASGEHQGFPGLLSLGTDVTAHVLVELVRSARSSWGAVVFVSGHGGNVAALARVRATADHEGDRVATWVPTDPGGDAHAGMSETSFLLTVPHLVTTIDVPGFTAGAEATDQMRREGLRTVSPTGVVGNPRDATETYGWTLRRRWCAEVVDIVRSLQGGS